MSSVQKDGSNRKPTPGTPASPPPAATDERGDQAASIGLPPIERIATDEIRVGAGGTLIVPREDIGADIDEGSELDLAGMLAQKIRKPGRREWIGLNPASELPTRMLLHKPKADGMEVEHYYVSPGLRALIRDELKDVRVFVFYSFATKSHALWIVNVTLENSWYESLRSLFMKPAEFFEQHAIRVVSDKGNSRYRVRFKPMPARVAWPAKATEQLLGEAIGASRFITTPDHPLYIDLIEGSELGVMLSQSDGEIWCIDTEWGFRDGRLDHESAWEPVVVCLVGSRSGRRLHFWGRDPRLPSFFRDHADDLFVAHYAVAELKYLVRLGITPPARWFDTFVAWRLVTNRPNNIEAGLSVALHRLGLPNLAPARKKDLQLKIAQLRFNPDDAVDRKEIIDYCFSDCDGCGALYSEIDRRVEPTVMAHWVEYLKAVARMELRGVPFDVEGMEAIQQRHPLIRATLIGDINKTWPIFAGESFRRDAFLAWCRKAGIVWPIAISPATGKPYHQLDDETFKVMATRHPFVAQVRQVRKTLAKFGQRSLVVDPVTRRHYYGTSVFRSVTGRNQPKTFVFSGPKWLRFLITPESPDHVLVYVDFTAQEIGIAAALSGDGAMRAIYESSDCHLAFAMRAGAAPAGATKATHAEVRKQYKTVNLGVQYGQTAFGIAARLGVGEREAEALLEAHKALFPRFWEWSERIVQGSFDRGWIITPCGWRSGVPPLSNERTWMNWPMQATGGDIMRLTVSYLDRQNVRILAPVHDGFLLSCRRDQLGELRDAVDYACLTAVDHVLPGFPLRWDFTVYDGGRFEDEDGLPLWRRLRSILEETDHVPYSP